MILGFSISLLVLLWALRNGQFKDQQRARFLPLQGAAPKGAAKVSKMNRYEGYALLFLVVSGLAATVVVLIFGLYS
jgi:hypothetical protein